MGGKKGGEGERGGEIGGQGAVKGGEGGGEGVKSEKSRHKEPVAKRGYYRDNKFFYPLTIFLLRDT